MLNLRQWQTGVHAQQRQLQRLYLQSKRYIRNRYSKTSTGLLAGAACCLVLLLVWLVFFVQVQFVCGSVSYAAYSARQNRIRSSPQHTFNASFRYREIAVQHSLKGTGGETLVELLELAKSYYPLVSHQTTTTLTTPGTPGTPSTDRSVVIVDVTVIIRHQDGVSICDQIDSILQQTVQPRMIWVCVLAAFSENGFNTVFQNKYSHDRRITLIESDEYNLRLSGVFQTALDVSTKYVWILDEDVHPGINHLDHLLKISSIPAYQGVLGSAGVVISAPELPLEDDESYDRQRREGASQPAKQKMVAPKYQKEALLIPDYTIGLGSKYILPVDFVMDSWFYEAAWTHVLFRKHLPELEAAPDILFAYTLQKYAQKQSFVLPGTVNHQELSYEDASNMYPELKNHRTAYSDGMFSFRNTVLWRLMQKGHALQWTQLDGTQMQELRRDVMVVVETVSQARDLCPFLRSFPSRDQYHLVVTDKQICRSFMGGCFNEIGSCTSAYGTDVLELGLPAHNAYGEAYSTIASVLKLYKPLVLITIENTASPVGSGIVAAAQDHEQTHAAFTLLNFPSASLPQLTWITRLPDLRVLAEWNTPVVQLRLIITEGEWLTSLDTLDSLLMVDFYGDNVDLFVYLNADVKPTVSEYLQEFKWPHGQMQIHQRYAQVELTVHLVESWFPTNNDEYAMFLEEMTIVSPYLYQWIKYSLLLYRYDTQSLIEPNTGQHLYGISGYNPLPAKRHYLNAYVFDMREHQKLLADNALEALPLELVTSSGTLFFPEKWRTFRLYLDDNYHGKDVVEGLPEWRRQFGLFMSQHHPGYILYPTFLKDTTLTTFNGWQGIKDKVQHSLILPNKNVVNVDAPIALFVEGRKDGLLAEMKLGRLPVASKLHCLAIRETTHHDILPKYGPQE